MNEQWLYETRINAPPRGDIPLLDDILDAGENVVEFFKGAGKGFGEALNAFEQNLTELSTKSSIIPASRAVRIVGLVLTGLKVLKILIGEDEAGGGSGKSLGAFEFDLTAEDAPRQPVSETFLRLYESARVRLSGAGYVIAEPTFLADPAV